MEKSMQLEVTKQKAEVGAGTGGWQWQVLLSPYLYEGSHDSPGFLIDRLTIPMGVESFQFPG